MNYARLKQDDRLVIARQTILIVKNDLELRSLLLRYGINDARLNEGLVRYEAAQKVTGKRIMDFGEGIGTTDAFYDALKQARETYGEIRSVVRVALRKADRGILTQLRLNQRTSDRIDGFITQAEHFYTEALSMPDFLAMVARFNITQDVLQAGLKQINAMNEARMKQKQQRGLAQVTTQRRRVAMEELDWWMKEFLGIIRIAVKKDPQQMEKLGIVVK